MIRYNREMQPPEINVGNIPSIDMIEVMSLPEVIRMIKARYPAIAGLINVNNGTLRM